MDGIPTVSYADVKRIVARDFPPQLRDRVWLLLKQFVDPLSPQSSVRANARIHLAILKLCGGHIDRLPSLVEEACLDWRDVLCPAEYPEAFEAGFVGCERMAKDELERVKQRDWDQYHAWLNHD